MKELILKLIYDQKGNIYTIILLVLIPLFLTVFISSVELTRNVDSSKVNIQNAVTEAVKSAALSVDSSSQANGCPLIDPDIAHSNFRKILAMNLGIDESSWTPFSGSNVSSPINYHLLVYNGSTSFGVSAGNLYEMQDGVLSSIPLVASGLPYEFGLGERTFTTPVTAVKKILLDKPGVIAIVEARITPLVIRTGPIAVKWASAKIITK